jgi:hypothetical protein
MFYINDFVFSEDKYLSDSDKDPNRNQVNPKDYGID